MHLYKYLPSQYVSNVLDKGEILFRNLTYFRQQEGAIRGDAFEGIHVDSPANDTLITNISKGFTTHGRFSFLNSTNSDHIFTFCLSQKLSTELMLEFNCDSCIEIHEPKTFIQRVRFQLARMVFIHSSGLHARAVDYYEPSSPVQFDVKNPANIVFSKNLAYLRQEEFRLCFGNHKAFKLTQQIINSLHNPFEDAKDGTAKDKLVKIGNINDIARTVVP